MSTSLRRAAYVAAATSTFLGAAACGQDDIVGEDLGDVTGGLGGGGAEGPYEDGDYSAEGEYLDGNGNPTTIGVDLTLEDDTVTAVTVTPQATDGTSLGFQNQFAGGIAAEVVGTPLAEVRVDKVSGSSLTQGGFNAAVAQIQDEASTAE